MAKLTADKTIYGKVETGVRYVNQGYNKDEIDKMMLLKQNLLTEAQLENLNADHSKYLTEHQDISGKQNVIEDLATIRENANKGADALQSLNDYAKKTELQTEVNKKQDKLTAGENVTIEGNVISAQGKNYDNDIEEINSNVAANAEAISSQFGEIVKQGQALAEAQKTIKALQREVELQKDFAEGVTWRKEIDNEPSYTKAIPKGSKGVTINSIGGKCIVENQTIITQDKTFVQQGVSIMICLPRHRKDWDDHK